MPHQRLKPTFTFDKNRLEELKKIAPEAFADGFINWDTLKEALGEYLEDDGPGAEHFGLFWPGKRQARKMASIPSKGTLVPVYGEGLKADGTPDTDGHNDSHNIFIEGENLEVLKLLQKSYTGRIKMIYIDPPYNTGNDFVYEDDFKEPLQEYLRRTGQVDEEGRPLTTNTRADGRFHSKWLSMMYPRLRLARNLLRDDGVIFVSIDDNEVHHLRMMMNEVFGEENFRNVFALRRYDKNLNRQFIEQGLQTFNVGFEYIICYSKSSEFYFSPILKASSEERQTVGYWKGFWNDADRPTMRYDILGVYPETGQWKWKQERAQKAVENYNNYLIHFSKKMTLEEYWTETGCALEFIRRNSNGRGKNKGIENWIPPAKGILRNTNWTDIFSSKITEEVESLFDFPKNPEIIRNFLIGSTEENDIILDFFSGSATTAQAVLELNKEDGGNRKFILVQMPEPCDEKSEAYKAGFKNIAEIGKERIRRVVKKLKEAEAGNNKNEKQAKISFEENNETPAQMDLGFKVVKLQSTHYKPWQNYEGSDIGQLEKQFELFASPLVEGWKEENLLTEIILLEGFPLDSAIEAVKEIKTNNIKQVTSAFHEHKLLVCLDAKIANETIKQLQLSGDDVFICLDSAISDEDKVRLADKGMIKTI